MSLKVFHVLFIVVASSVCFYFGIWAYSNSLGLSYKVAGIVSLVGGVGLIFYGFFFWRKLKKVN